MRIEFQNLGCIDNGSIELNDFTIFCGKNNSGKTYAMYSIYALLANKFAINFDFVKPIVERLKKEGSVELDIHELLEQYQTEMLIHIEECFKEHLPNLFGVSENEFTNTEIKISILDSEIQERIERICNFEQTWSESDELCRIYFRAVFGKVILSLNNTEIKNDNLLQRYISEKLVHVTLHSSQNILFPAERNGINDFYKELFSIRNLLLQQAQNSNINAIILLKDVLNARYAEPIKDYLQFFNNIEINQQRKSDYSNYARIIQNNVIGGDYLVDELGSIYFMPHQNNKNIPLHFSSSTVKSLFGLVFYLKHLAKKGDYLMIDEPELNLHPDNQRQVARILAQLVNAGLKVVVSTHSNYFIREINNLIMLKNDFKGVEKLRKKYKYQPEQLLDVKQVSAYLFDNNTIKPMIQSDEGIIAETFDTVTNDLNQSSDDIYYTMQDAKEIDD